MKILVLNCGSSSIKYQLVDIKNDMNILAKGILEKIGLPIGIMTHKPTDKNKFEIEKHISDHKEGLEMIVSALTDKNHGVISNINEINAAGHRVAHGGEFFDKSAFINAEVKSKIEKCCELAPLHNPASLAGILSVEALLPNLPQVAVFDTSFHQTMPEKAYLYAIPYQYYENYNIRRYGFHGTSHKFVAEGAAKCIGKEAKDLKIITCHLGNGASIAAINKGKSFDTSMGFTPIEGLMMGTRAGDLDLGICFYLMEKENLDIKAANDLFNKKSGLMGLSGISSDMRELESAADKGDERAKVALEMFSYRVKKYVGAYAAAMGGVDLIVFTGGIGENADIVRKDVCEGMEFLGLHFDEKANKGLRGKVAEISTASSKVKAFVFPTDEEYVIAIDTKNIVSAL